MDSTESPCTDLVKYMSSVGGGSSRKKEEDAFWSRGDWLFSLEASIISSSTADNQHVQMAISTPVK